MERTRQRPERPPRRRLGPDAAERVSAGVYGSLVAAATLIGASDEPLWDLVLVVIATNLIYYATHVFAYVVGSPPEDDDTAPAKLSTVIVHHIRVGAPIASAAFAPIVIVLVLVLLGVDQKVASFWGVAEGGLSLATIATSSIYLRGVRGWMLLLAAVVSVLVAAALVAAKLALH